MNWPQANQLSRIFSLFNSPQQPISRLWIAGERLLRPRLRSLLPDQFAGTGFTGSSAWPGATSEAGHSGWHVQRQTVPGGLRGQWLFDTQQQRLQMQREPEHPSGAARRCQAWEETFNSSLLIRGCAGRAELLQFGGWGQMLQLNEAHGCLLGWEGQVWEWGGQR